MIILHKPTTFNSLRYTILRYLSTAATNPTPIRTINVNFGLIHETKDGKKPKGEKTIYRYNNFARIKHLDRKFRIMNKSQTRILDLGYAPGSWIEYIRERMATLHGVPVDKINKKCHILGFDVMFGLPPVGVSSIQGNIFSKSSQQQVIDHFKEVAWMEYKHKSFLQEDELNPRSYLSKEQDEAVLSREIRRIEIGLNNYRTPMRRRDELRMKRDMLLPEHRIDLAFHDLSTPAKQVHGFYSTSVSQPFLKYNHYDAYNHTIMDPNDANFDLVDASLLLNCRILKPGGKFVIRLDDVNPADEEFEVLKEKLSKVFNSVLEVNNYATDEGKVLVQSFEKYFICENKKEDDEYDLHDLFSWSSPPPPPPKIEAETEVEVEAQTEAKTEAEVEAKAQTQAKVEIDAKTAAQAQPQAATQPSVEEQPQVDVQPQAEAQQPEKQVK